MSNLLTDEQGRPVPQLFNPATGTFEKIVGENGKTLVTEENSATVLVKTEDLKTLVSELKTINNGISVVMTAIKDTNGIKKIIDNVNVDVVTIPTVTETNSSSINTLLGNIETLLTTQATTLDTIVANQSTMITHLANIDTNTAP